MTPSKPAPGFPNDIPAAESDDPAKPWRVTDASGNTTDYHGRQDARSAMYGTRGSSAVYTRDIGKWWLYETLLRED